MFHFIKRCAMDKESHRSCSNVNFKIKVKLKTIQIQNLL